MWCSSLHLPKIPYVAMLPWKQTHKSHVFKAVSSQRYHRMDLHTALWSHHHSALISEIFRTRYNSVITFGFTSDKSIILFTIKYNLSSGSYLFKNLDYFMWMSILLVHIYICHVHAWCIGACRGQRGASECEPPCGCWETNSGSLQGVPLTSQSISPAQGCHFYITA